MLRHLKETFPGESADKGRLTAVRREVKYQLKPEDAQKALSAVGTHVPLKVYDGALSSFRISVYLDSADRALASAELKAKGHSSIKLRAKDYYLIQETKPVFEEKCFLEVKARLGSIVEKSRFRIKRQEMARVLINGPTAVARPADRAAVEAFEEVRGGRALKPLFVVHYHRTTFEDQSRMMRITFDDHVTYHLPPPGLYVSAFSCSRADLPPPLLVETDWIVEMKTVGSLPDWVSQIFKQEQKTEYSKFGVGVRELVRRGLLKPQ